MLNAGSDATPQPLGAATHGTSAEYSRADHIHAMPTAADVGAAADARQIIAGTGLTGGGDLSADRTLAVSYGTTAGTVAEGDDARLSDARTPITHATTHATGGGDAITPASIGAAPNTSPQVQIFQTVGTATWTKPAGAVRVRVQGWGAGGGGGSGRRGPTGELRCGGGGGGSGVYFDQMILASAFGATESVVISDGGNGGAAQTVDATNGSNGVIGGISSFGTLNFFGGGNGGGGSVTAGTSGSAPWGGNTGGALSATSTVAGGGVPANTSSTSTSGGSGGGGSGGLLLAASSVGISGGVGGRYLITNLLGGTIGTTSVPNGGAGNSTGVNSNGYPMGASGGGGGASTLTGTAGNGGVGGFPGGGGGGGGASQNGVNSGAGGKGGQGLVVITTYFA